MRTIKFRGKRVDNGEWIYGVLNFIGAIESSINNGYGSKDVLSETVGQFTGLYDKNYEEIYEGDILEMSWKYAPASRGFVEWSDTRFKLVTEDEAMSDRFCFKDASGLEAIGNIHDNKELL